MRTSKNLGMFNRFVTLLFHGDWLFLFLFLFLSNARIDRIDRRIDSLTEEIWRAFFLWRWKFVTRGKNKNFCKWKSVMFKFCMLRNERKKNFYQRHTKLFHPRSSTKRTFPQSAVKNSFSFILSFHVFRSFPHTLSLFLLLAHVIVFSLKYINVRY